MKTYTVQKQRTVPIGQPYQLTSKYMVFNENVKLIDKDTGEIIAIFLKKYIRDPILLDAGRNLVVYKGQTTNRGDAAGVDKAKQAKYGVGKMGTANAVDSSIVGFTESVGGLYKCRMTRLYSDHFNEFNRDTQHLINFIDKTFAKFAPTQYKKQHAFIKAINQNMRLAKTVYTTCTVNVDFRTMTHIDKGDFHSGLGNLAVFKTGNFTGGELLLPEFYVAFHIEEGDLLFFNVHEIHCNAPIKGKGRVSLVCYAREKILGKCDKVSTKQLKANTASKLLQAHNIRRLSARRDK